MDEKTRVACCSPLHVRDDGEEWGKRERERAVEGKQEKSFMQTEGMSMCVRPFEAAVYNACCCCFHFTSLTSLSFDVSILSLG